MVEAAKSWAVTSSAGGKYPGADPAFFKDRNRVAVVTSLAIKIFQLTTKQVIAKITADCSDVVQLYLTNDESAFFLVRSDGSIDRVGVKDNTVEKYDAPKRVLHIINDIDGVPSSVIVRTPDSYSIVNLEGGNNETIFEAKHASLFALSPSREYVVFANPRTIDTIIDTFHLPTKVPTQSLRERPSSCLAISNKGLVAVGAPSGVIDVYYAKGIRTLKWHLEAVEALQFSLNDDYLISGGKERVLVFWQMDADKQQFLPRLDGTITSICINSSSTLYGITLANRQVVVLSAVDLTSRLQVAGTKAYFARKPADPERERKKQQRLKSKYTPTVDDYTTNYTIHPGTRHGYFFSDMSVDNANDGSGSQIQIFNPSKDEQEAVFSLAPTVQPGKVRQEQRILDPDATHLEFTSNGQWMVTVDVKRTTPIDSLMSRHDIEVTLKFWRQDSSTNQWTVVTRVVAPHGAGKRIKAVRCSATENAVLTASEDGGVRLWRLNDKQGAWSLRRILPGFATNTSDVGLAWSHDSSVVALGFDTNIYLLDGARLQVQKMLPNVLGAQVRGLDFVGNYLVALSANRLAVWDLVANAQLWSIKLEVHGNGNRLLAVDPFAGRLALAVNYWTQKHTVNSKIALFNIKSPLPLAMISHHQAVSALKLVPGTQSYSFIDTTGSINSIAGAQPLATQDAPSFQDTLVTLLNEAKVDYDAMELDEQPVSQALDVNSFDKVFDGDSTNVEALFDRVMSLISPLN